MRPDPLLRTLIRTTGRHPVTGLEKRLNQAVPLLKAMGGEGGGRWDRDGE